MSGQGFAWMQVRPSSVDDGRDGSIGSLDVSRAAAISV